MATKSSAKDEPTLSGLPVTPADLEKTRNEIVSLIMTQSPKMVERVLRSGDLEALKFLWGIAGLFPPASANASPLGQYLDDPED